MIESEINDLNSKKKETTSQLKALGLFKKAEKRSLQNTIQDYERMIANKESEKQRAGKRICRMLQIIPS